MQQAQQPHVYLTRLLTTQGILNDISQTINHFHFHFRSDKFVANILHLFISLDQNGCLWSWCVWQNEKKWKKNRAS